LLTDKFELQDTEMNIGQLEDGFFISGQLTAQSITELAEQGIKTIINNRPDGEGGFYPAHSEMQELARQHGMEYRFIPINLMGLSMETVQAQAEAIAQLPKPMVAYCASGSRTASLWALAAASRKSADDIISSCALQGHNIAQMRPLLMQLGSAV
jgi:sulfide:quinone oxidoreductase